MIYDALKYIQEGLEQYLAEGSSSTSTETQVTLDNIGLAEELGGTKDDLNQRIVISLVNLQEEATLKNLPNYKVRNGRTEYERPPIHLNLFVLISVLDVDNYENALRRISSVVAYFQSQREFSFQHTPTSTGAYSQEVRVIMDLYTLTFEQLNHLWGALGGKQIPFVLYKARVVPVSAEKPQAEGGIITDIYVNESP
jgi:hypothetical protein